MAFRKLEQSFCVLEYARTSSVVTVQRRFRAEFQKAAPVFNSIKKWYAKFRDEGCLCIAPRPGRPGPSEETVNWIRETYQHSSCKSTICKKTWRVSLSISIRITMIRCVVYLLRIFKMFRGLMNNPVFNILRTYRVCV